LDIGAYEDPVAILLGKVLAPNGKVVAEEVRFAESETSDFSHLTEEIPIPDARGFMLAESKGRMF